MKVNSNLIRIMYAQKGMTLCEFAEASGITDSGVHLILKRGTALPDSVVKMAKALNTDPLSLIASENEKA